MLATSLRSIARALVLLGVIALFAAVIFPTSMSGTIFLGLALWVSAFLITFTRAYILRAPLPGRGGLFEYRAHPVAYHVGFDAVVAIFGFILGILIRGFLAS